ncbi:Homoserine dehydrogenase [[Clostridium] ultunense Esp]|uniref:Homoserine dehydrogenase n=1 Tax=[Clostridium] ultunense Esp TaxID=1288971 RepID=M1ZH01_9FIRM|nr:homoserine dehydrogenase [Schnuerera ultunensis]CCQ93097.1 Homoserine dehydrogenase [[Clostridium] ultunense Esp]SHD77882.1 Homoserine dehydrogenase [[Clostridium] ultunense Esp]
MRIAIIGYGGVGRAFLRLLLEKKDELLNEGIVPNVKYVIASKGGVYNPNGIDIEEFINYSKTNKDIMKFSKGNTQQITFNNIIENKDVDVVIEMTPTNKKTGEPGMTHIVKSLENGFHVITANKGPILLAYRKLREIASKNKVQLGIGCTTGGALPTINGGLIDMAGSTIQSIEGVLNGTTNFILNEMETNKVEYVEALKKAQQLGIAETDPTLDVEGWDTAIKLLILTNVLMEEEKKLEDIEVEGISKIKASEIFEASKKGKKYKLVGKAVRLEDGLDMSVRLEKLDPSNPLYGVDGKNKGVRYVSDTLGDLTIIGGASGVTPAAASILRDLINIKRGYKFII